MKLSFLKCGTSTFEIWQVGTELHELLLQPVYVDAMHVVAMRGAEDGGGHAGGLTRDIAARHYAYGGLHMSVRTDVRYALPPPCSSAPFARLDLSVVGESGNQLEIADDPRGVVQIAASALRAGIQPVLADVAAGIAQRVGYIESQVIAAGANRRVQQKQILLFGQMLVQIDMAGAAAVQIPGEGFTVEPQLVQNVHRRVLGDEEIVVVAVARHIELAFFVPRSVLHAQPLGRHHLGVEHQLAGARGAIGGVNRRQYRVYISDVFRIVCLDGNVQRLRSFHQTIDADGQILLVQRNIACIIYRQQTGRQPLLQDLVEGDQIFVNLLNLYLHPVHDIAQRCIPHRILHQTVDVRAAAC